MRTLLIGIVAIGLMALPASAVVNELAKDTVVVTITVTEYGSITLNPGTMSFEVPGPYEAGADYGAIEDFTVLCNVACTLTVKPDTTSDSDDAVVVPGEYGGEGTPYPTATGTEIADGHFIGFGIALTNLATNTYVKWGDVGFEDVAVGFGPSLKDDPAENARITLNSYMDSARGDDVLAPPGPYTSTLTLTLATGV